MKNSNHTSKTLTYTQERLLQLGISSEENQLINGQTIFQAYFYNQMEDEIRHLSQKEIDQHLAQKKSYDNILIRYANIWGEPLIQKAKSKYEPTGNIYHQEPDYDANGRKWAKQIFRLRIHEKNRYPIKVLGENRWKLSTKYRAPKNSQIDVFFNGIYQYFIRPLLQKGLDKKTITQQIKRMFQKICITEGEFKAFYACKLGIPTLGIGGVHSAVKTIKAKTGKETEKTIDAIFFKSLSDFLQAFEVQKIIYLHDSDAFDNKNNLNRALGTFYASIRNFFFAVKNFCRKHKPVQMDYAVILPHQQHKQGLDDLLLAHPCQVNAIKQDLLSPVYYRKKTFIYKWSIIEKEDLSPIQVIFEQSVFKAPVLAYRMRINKRTSKKHKTRLTKILKGIDLSNIRLYAPTGTGKTYLVNQLPGRKILVCSTIALLENAVNEYGFLPFSGDYQNQEAAKKHPKIVTTYASFQKLTAYIGHSNSKGRNRP